MKKRTGISLMLALLMVVSTFAIAGSTEIVSESCPPGEVVFEKEVWNGTVWDEFVEAQIGETVTFKITMTYIADAQAPSDWTLNTIKVWDQLPECLDYIETTSITTSGTHEIVNTEQVSGKWVYWNFTWNKPELYDGESLYIEFTAEVIDSQELENENIAYFHVKEDCTYYHDGNDNAWVFVVECGDPGIEIEKKVWDGEMWNDEITEYICIYELLCEGQYIDFQINVSNTGEIALRNVIVTDVLPEFLKYRDSSPSADWVSPDERTIVWELGTIPTGEYRIITFSAWINPTYFLMHEMGEGDNVANATSDQTEVVEDSVHIVIYKRLSVDKKVWDGQGWVDELDSVRKGQEVKFQITTTYHGPGTSLMDCAVIGDLLSSICLEYDETTYVEVAGQVLEPGSNEYPYVVPDHGTTLQICGEDVEIPELVQCGEDEYYVIVWDFREAWYFELHDGESIVIEFTTTVTQYCDCIATDCAFAIGWGCYICDPCNYYLDWDCAKVNCSQPPSRFDKKAQKDGSWVDEGIGVLGDQMVFKLEFEYYGNDDLVDLRFKDEMPCVLEYAGLIESTINISVWVSEDKKTIWFNMSEDTVTDGDIVQIIFAADITGITGDCCPDPAKNKAWLYVLDCTGQLIFEYYDEILVKTHHRPCKPIIRDDAEGEAGEEIGFTVEGADPDLDDVYYWIDWGDGGRSGWLGPYTSGEVVEVAHIWEEPGDYTVRAKCKDIYDAESGWGNDITVTITGDPVFQVTIKKGIGRGISASIKNKGTSDIDDITWELCVWKPGIFGKTLVQKNDSIPTLAAGTTETVGANPFAFGRISVKINVTVEGKDPIVKTAKGFIFLRFVWLR